VTDRHCRCARCRESGNESREAPWLCEDCQAEVVPAHIHGWIERVTYASGYATAIWDRFVADMARRGVHP
jgi:hypothetical protein